MIQTELDVLRDVSQRLTAGGVAFMLTGSMAMNYYAQPRMTRDIDLVVKLASEQIDLLISMFETDYYVDRHAVARAISERLMFNLIHNETIIKIDCIILKSDEYRQEEFARRRLVALGDFETWIVSREDLILSKLYWASDSKSELQLRDVKNLLTVDCDMPYLYSRAEDLGVKALFLPAIGFAGRWGFCEVMNDTEPQIAKLVRSRLLERSGAERILMGSRMFDVAKTIMLASFPEGLTEIEIKARLCERLYGDEVDVSAFLQHLRSLQPDPSAE